MKAHKVLEVFSGGVFFFLGGGACFFFFNFRECVSDTGTSQFTKQFNDWVKGPKRTSHKTSISMFLLAQTKSSH